jgi:hypothetical protein
MQSFIYEDYTRKQVCDEALIKRTASRPQVVNSGNLCKHMNMHVKINHSQELVNGDG